MALQSGIALASITLQQATSSITFSGIPQNYRDLIFTFSGGLSSTNDLFSVRFNSDASPSYNSIYMITDGSSALSAAEPNLNQHYLARFSTGQESCVMQIMDYSQTDKHKSSVVEFNAINWMHIQNRALRWASTDAINTITVYTPSINFAAGSTFNLYGRIG